MVKNVKIGKVVLAFSLLKDATLGEMNVNDKLNVINALGAIRKITTDFEVFKNDIAQKMTENSEQERMAALLKQANTDVEISGYNSITMESLGQLIDANKKFTVDEMTVLQELLVE